MIKYLVLYVIYKVHLEFGRLLKERSSKRDSH